VTSTSRARDRRIDDTFFRRIVAGMRNGVLAITRDCRVAFINDEACRIFGVTEKPAGCGRTLADVLRGYPDVVRVLTSAFELHLLPNRAELRLKPSNRVIGYTLALVSDDDGSVAGAARFF
jgi:PAS domain-containing protein